MALSLKGSGLATNLVFCLAVDDDDTTIKEFVSADGDANKTVESGVTVGTATWKGGTRGYIETTTNGSFDYKGVRFPVGHQTSVDWSSGGHSFFMACAGASDLSGIGVILEGVSARASAGGPLQDPFGTHNGSTNLPTNNSTKFSCGFSHNYGVAYAMYYGLESGALAADGSGAEAGFGSVQPIAGLGGSTSNGNQPGKYHIVAVFNRVITLSEFQSLHGDGIDDWRSTLFTSGGSSNGAAMYHHLRNMGAY
jgi:hypothetical protein